jgi:hypothetical protein
MEPSLGGNAPARSMLDVGDHDLRWMVTMSQTYVPCQGGETHVTPQRPIRTHVRDRCDNHLQRGWWSGRWQRAKGRSLTAC